MRKIWYFVTALYLCMLTYASLNDNDFGFSSSETVEFLYNFLHIPAYAFLTYLLFQCAGQSGPTYCKVIFVLAFMYGIIIESVQVLIPARYPSVADLALNSVGILLVIIGVNKKIFKIYI